VAEEKRLPLPSPLMSLKPCRYTGITLAENVTCGGLCDSFPSCLPLPSSFLADEIAQLRTRTAHDHQNYTATAEALQAINEALVMEQLAEGEQE
jgi:hypothetical protein